MHESVLELVRRGVEAASALSRAEVPEIGLVEGNTPPLQALGTLFRVQRIEANAEDLSFAPAHLRRYEINFSRPPVEMMSKAFALSQFAFARLAPLDAAGLTGMVNACRDALLANGFPPPQLPLYLMDVLELVVRIFAEPACAYTLTDEADARDYRLGILGYELISLESPRGGGAGFIPIYSVFVAARNNLIPSSGYLYRLVAERFEGDARDIEDEARKVAAVLLGESWFADSVAGDAAAWNDKAVREQVVTELLDASQWEEKAYKVALILARQIARRDRGRLNLALTRVTPGGGPLPLFSPMVALSMAPLQFPRMTPGMVTNLRTSPQFLQQLEAGDREQIARLVESLTNRMPPGTTGSERPQQFSLDEMERAAAEELRTVFDTEMMRTGRPTAGEVQYLGSRPADPGGGIGRKKWTRFSVRPGPEGRRIVWHDKTDPVPLDRGGDEPGGPDIAGMLIALDASGSMAGEKFRTAVVAAFGCIKGLLRIRRDLRWSSLVFSNRTLYGGWHSSEDVDRVKGQLTQFLGGGTHIDPAVLDRALAERPGPIAVLLITDGAVANAEVISRKLADFVAGEPGSQLLHLNIGSPNELTGANAAAGLPVQCIADEKDLPGLALRFAADAGLPRQRREG